MELKITTRNKAVAGETLQGDKKLRLPRDILVEFKGVEFKKVLMLPK